MRILKNSEFIEKTLRKRMEINTGLKIAANSWVIEEIEILLNCYPILRKFNYKCMSLQELQALVQRLSESLEMEYAEEGDLIFVDLTEMKTFFSLTEMILWLIIASLTDKPHVHFKFDEKLFNDMKVSEANVIDYLCDNSYFITNSAKKECHFVLSAPAILGFDYNNQDEVISSLMSIQKRYKKDLSLSAYINYRKFGQNIDDKPSLQKQSKRIRIKI
jgi:hypothetical protein